MNRWAWIAVGGSLGLAAILTIALVVAIASGGDDGGGSTPTQTTPSVPQTFGGPLGGGGLPPEVEECLSEQGLEHPGSGGGVPSEDEIERLREAIGECGLPAPQILTPGS